MGPSTQHASARAGLPVLVLLLSACGRPDPSPVAAASPAPAPLPEAAPPAPAAETPARADPVRGSETGSCSRDEDCHFDDLCLPQRCVSSPPIASPCDESMRPPGVCLCLAGRCALRPDADRPEVTSEGDCAGHGPEACGLDLAAGLCVPGRAPDRTGDRWTGPRCWCGSTLPRRCHFGWVEPVECRTTDDCWVTHEPFVHPIARPRELRGRRFRPCADGEVRPVCRDGLCDLDALRC